MAGKIHVFLVGLGVFLMLAAGGAGVKLLLSERSPKAPDDTIAATNGTPRMTASPTPSPTAAPVTPSPTTAKPSTTTPRPTTTTPRPTTPPPPPPPPPPPAWNQIFFDDFNDLSQWGAANDVSGSDVSCLRSANAVVSGGILTLRAQAEEVTCGNGETRAYTTGSVTSNVAFVYGAFEVRARGPIGVGTGLGAASWIGDVSLGLNNADWHTYRTEWEVGVIRRYVDDVEISTMDTSAAPGAGLNIRLALGVNTPDGTTTLPAEFQIDFVRVFSR